MRVLHITLLCMVVLIMSACDGPLSLLTGGGPNVAANVQAGKTNSQTVGRSSTTEQKIGEAKAATINQSSDAARVKADRVETVVVQEYPVWLILAFAFALFLDSPMRWPEQIFAAFRRKK